MKILDVDLFQDGLRRNIAMLDRLESEVEAIRRAVEGLVAMEDELKGQGGSAIRAFYAECHLPLLQQFLVSAAGYKQVLQQMENALYALEPDTSGHIVEQFLEGEVEQGLTTIAQLTENLTNESNSIMDQVSDIVALPHLDDSGVQEGILDAKRKRDDTVSRLQEFDATQTAALLPFEQDIQAMDTWIRNMEEMFTSNLTDIHFQTDRWAELVACSPPLTISTPTIEGEMCLREDEEEKSVVDTGLEVVDGILSSLFDVGKDFVTGIVDIVQDPKATLDATLEAVTNPIETYNTIKSAITTSYERDMVNGDANSRAHWVTYALGTVATSVVGTKGVGALTKSGVTITKAVAPKVVGAAKNASDSLANLLPYGPRTQFAIAGEVPYNTVNAAGLRDQVISIARVESGVKGIGQDLSKSPRNKPGVVNESFKLDRSLKTQTKLMYNKGAIGVIPKEIRNKLIGKQFNSFDDFRKEFWKSVANSSFAKEFNNRNVSRMIEGNAPIAPKIEHYGKHKSYILHHKQPIDKGGEVYNLDNLMINSPKMHQNILDPTYHFGKKGQ